jgi:cell division protein FtsI/penicillin-binding protein 2
VAFAPANNPEIAVAVVVPSAFVPSAPNTITKELARSALDTYFDLKKKGEQEVKDQEENQQAVIANDAN